MVPVRILIVTLILLTGVFAGCLGGDEDDPEPKGREEPRPTEDAGTITGKVLDVNLNPIDDARIMIIDTPGEVIINATTEEDGSYVVNDVPPGDYRMTVTAFCCREDRVTISVEANKEVTQSFMLEPYSSDDLKVPYEAANGHTGFIACQFTLPTNQSSGCGAVPGNVPRHTIGVGKGLRTIVAALEWEGGAGLSEVQDLEFRIRSQDDEEYAWVSGSSPLIIRIDNSEITSPRKPFEAYDEDGLALELSARPVAGSFVYQRPIEFHWYLHYWEEGPESAQALPDE